MLPVGLALTALLVFRPTMTGAAPRNLSYTGFINEVTSDKVGSATITSTGSVSGKLLNGDAYTSRIPTALDDTSLSPLLLAHKVQ